MVVSRYIIALLVMAAVTAMFSGCGSSSGGSSLQIAFQSGSGIAVMNGDGTNVRPVILAGSQPSLSRDGRLIAFVSGPNIFVSNITGTSVTQITNNGVGVTVSSPAFSPLGDRIAFVVLVVAPGAVPEIHIINTNGTGEFLLVTNATQPTFSPGGNQIAFVRDGDIFLINTDGTGLINLTNGTAGFSVSNPSFSPTGDVIAFSALKTVTSASPSIRIVGVSNHQITNVIDNGITPSFGPGGVRIAFVRDGAIFTTNTIGTDLIQLTTGPGDADPSFQSSP